MWQRLNKLESITFYLGMSTPAPNQLLLNKLSILGNIKKLRGEFLPKHVAIVTKIIEKCQSKIEWYSMNVALAHKENVISPVKLVNAKYISLRCLYFYIIWTNKCETLRLHSIDNISKKWCNFVVNNCDCSNIKSLCLRWVTFLKNDFINNNTNNNNNKIQQHEGQEILKQFAQQFINVEHLIFDFYDECDDVLLLFCKYLNETIKKNNMKIQLEFGDNFPSYEYRKLNKCIEKIDIGNKIQSIMFFFEFIGKYENIHSTFKPIKQMLTIANSSVERIKFETQYTLRKVTDSIVDYINPMTFKSLKIFDYWGISKASVQIVNKILQIEFNKLSKSKLFIIITFRSESQYDKNCGHFFDKFCQRIFNLMIKDKIGMEVKLILTQIKDESTHNQCYNDIFLSYFNDKRMLKEYKQPQCSEYCTPLKSPKISFVWDDHNSGSVFIAQNATKSDVFNHLD